MIPSVAVYQGTIEGEAGEGRGGGGAAYTCSKALPVASWASSPRKEGERPL